MVLTVEELIKASFEARTFSYCKYSNFRVGAALETTDGKLFTGCNVENVSFGATICAEKTAICKAVSEGYRNFSRISIASDLKDEVIAPCGSCRQFIAEFSADCEVYMTNPNGEFVMKKCKELLPMAFDKESLKFEKIII